MPTNFPTSVDALTNPISNDSLNSPSHSLQHANANDAIEAIEGYLLTGAGAAGLVLLKSQTVGTTVGSVTVTDAFNTTYNDYKILYVGGASSLTSPYLYMTISGTTGNNYFTSGVYQTLVAAAQVTFNFATTTQFYVGAMGTFTTRIEIDICNPFLSLPKTLNSRWSNYDLTTSTGGVASATSVASNSATAFTLSPATGTITGGTIYVYGYKKA